MLVDNEVEGRSERWKKVPLFIHEGRAPPSYRIPVGNSIPSIIGIGWVGATKSSSFGRI